MKLKNFIKIKFLITISSIICISSISTISILFFYNLNKKDKISNSFGENSNNLNTKSNSTTLDIQDINFNDELFSKIFDGYSYFSDDWKLGIYNNIIDKNPTEDLKNFLNINKEKYFSNLPEIDNPVKTVQIVDENSGDKITFKVIYEGYGIDGITIKDIEQNIYISLTSSSKIQSTIGNFITSTEFENWLNKNKISWPNSKVDAIDKFQKFVDYKIDSSNFTGGVNIPNIYIPLNASVDPNKIKLDQNYNIKLYNGAVKFYSRDKNATINLIVNPITFNNPNPIESNGQDSIERNNPDTSLVFVISYLSIIAFIILLLIVAIIYVARKNKQKINEILDESWVY